MEDRNPGSGPEGSLLAALCVGVLAILLVVRLEAASGNLADLAWMLPLSLMCAVAGLMGTLHGRTRWPWLVALVAGCWPIVRVPGVMHLAMTGHWHAH